MPWEQVGIKHLGIQCQELKETSLYTHTMFKQPQAYQFCIAQTGIHKVFKYFEPFWRHKSHFEVISPITFNQVDSSGSTRAIKKKPL